MCAALVVFLGSRSRSTYDNIVDGDEDELHEETNESHDRKSYDNLEAKSLVLLDVWFRAALHQSYGVLCEVLQRLRERF